jgi:uncharacterized protein
LNMGGVALKANRESRLHPESKWDLIAIRQYTRTFMSNRLARETSPYLLQHAENPVDWYPWGDEALARARAEDRPILLSIGYSACHWCHVMAHESFEDAEVAAVMNRHFVNVKVDREERPDLDQIYQLAHQMMTERGGGWPLTVFLTPGLVPLFAGTYFPRKPRFNLPGFADLCERVNEVWRSQRNDIERQAAQLAEALREAAREGAGEGARSAGDAIDAEPLDKAYVALRKTFDRDHGGFGTAPKFPHAAELEFCLRRHLATGDPEPLRMVTLSLDRMAQGGLFDQLGGGFARYSVDARWTIPHFEKMLSDNGLLLRLYANAWALTRNPLYERVMERTAAWIMREMQSPGGAYYASLDADSEHEEGTFYLWERDEIRDALSAEEYAAAMLYFGLDGAPNFEGSHWHLNVERSVETVAKRQGISREHAASLIEAASAKLFAVREKRVRPDCDRKLLTGWNALVIEAMARAGRALGRGEWIDSAARAMRFIRAHLWREGRLLACATDPKNHGGPGAGAVHAHLNAYLDDHAYLLAAAIELLQARFDPELLKFSTQLADVLLERFEDSQGGFFFTSDDHETLIARMKTLHDGAQPSGNGVALLSLGRLGHLTGAPRYLQAAERGLASAMPALRRAPHAHVSHLFALEEYLSPTQTVIIRGPESALESWTSELAARCLPTTLVLGIPDSVTGLPDPLAKPVRPGVNGWVCQGVTCLEPVSSLAALESQVFKDGQKR